MKHIFLVVTAALSAALFLTSCETAEDRQLAAAQDCIDTAKVAADADRCVALVEGLETEKSYLIRCSANYIAQGFTGARMASAFQRLLDDNGSGQDPMATVMAYLVFSNNAATHSVDNAVSNCTKSGVRSMLRLVTMSKLATFITTAGLGSIPANANPLDPSFDPSQISTAITTIVGSGSPADKENIGNIAITAQTAYCNAGSSFENNEICSNLNQAIAAGGGNAQTIGEQLLALLQANN
jgi:hypothetical protein